MSEMNAQTTVKEQAEHCVVCGGSAMETPAGGSSILCEECAQTVDLPMSAYYLTQYYFRFAD